jgi:hypothetical protein
MVAESRSRVFTSMHTLAVAAVWLALAGCEQAECFQHCNDHYERVCGDDERTHLNPCHANCSGTTVDYAGPCLGEEPQEQQ